MVEKDTGLQNSLVVGTRNKTSSHGVQIPPKRKPPVLQHDLPTPTPSPEGRIYPSVGGMVKEYMEVWDYAGGARFRGFVAEKDDERGMFIFFDQEVMGQDLKPG